MIPNTEECLQGNGTEDENFGIMENVSYILYSLKNIILNIYMSSQSMNLEKE